eukprot:TRINITY_DN2321_c2_g1_i2.p2 TRINITY_DN2321_c2_g1~~TRINITY_DN2321_c2_g1_i2.p2  ORF type:complete len:126 (+),score=22.18 TRINITY_DN2321_c2_g1_i2:14-391(+)
MQHIAATTAVSEFWLNKCLLAFARGPPLLPRDHVHVHAHSHPHSHPRSELLERTCCAGWSIEDIATEGFDGVASKIQSVCRLHKHLDTALKQIVNFLLTLQGEIAGAQELSNVGTFLACGPPHLS